MAKSFKRSIDNRLKDRIGESISFNDIRINGGTQNRVLMDKSVIKDYSEAMLQDNSDFPPIVLFKDIDNNYWLADGFHRLEAMKLNGLKKAICIIKKGDLRDAILYSLSANATHGLRRTNEDKRNAVLVLLQDEEWKKYSAVKIAKLAGVNDKTVGNIKREMGLSTSNVIGDDGREYNLKTTSEIPKSKTTRKKYYRFKMDLDYKENMQEIIKETKLNESALLKEAFDLLRNKYLLSGKSNKD